MIKRRHGYIIGICSMIALKPTSKAITYTATKFAVRGFMDALHQESRHEKWGIKTLTIFPHLTNTRKELMDYVREKVG